MTPTVATLIGTLEKDLNFNEVRKWAYERSMARMSTSDGLWHTQVNLIDFIKRTSDVNHDIDVYGS